MIRELFCCYITFSLVGALEPTKLVNNNTYRLVSQHDHRYLTVGTNGIPTKAESKADNPSQKFTFVNSNDKNSIWMLVSLATGAPLGNTSYQVSYVGHGKYQFKNVKTGKCLQGDTEEGVCGKEIPIQRWFVEVSN